MNLDFWLSSGAITVDPAAPGRRPKGAADRPAHAEAHGVVRSHRTAADVRDVQKLTRSTAGDLLALLRAHRHQHATLNATR